MNGWTAVGALALAVAVCLGAFGAHGLRNRLDAYSMGVFEKAVFYHFVHALGVLIVPVIAKVQALTPGMAARVCVLLMAGIVLFSGSLYILAVTGVRAMGMVTPFGGVSFVVAWTLLAWALWRGPESVRQL